MHFLCTCLAQFLDVDIVSVWRLSNLDSVMQEYASRVAYCIPILATAATCYDVSIQQTPEMQKEAGRMLCLEQNRFHVDIFCSTWLVTHLCRGQGKPPGVPGAQSLSASKSAEHAIQTLLSNAFSPCGAGTWQTNCSMNPVNPRGNAW